MLASWLELVWPWETNGRKMNIPRSKIMESNLRFFIGGLFGNYSIIKPAYRNSFNKISYLSFIIL